jgi:hypothetical protein
VNTGDVVRITGTNGYDGDHVVVRTGLDNGDLKYEIDFRSVYASLLQNKMNFDYNKIGITNKTLNGLF